MLFLRKYPLSLNLVFYLKDQENASYWILTESTDFVCEFNSHTKFVCKLMYFIGINVYMDYLSQALSNFGQVCENRTL